MMVILKLILKLIFSFEPTISIINLEILHHFLHKSFEQLHEKCFYEIRSHVYDVKNGL